jgi:hypothetical protein
MEKIIQTTDITVFRKDERLTTEWMYPDVFDVEYNEIFLQFHMNTEGDLKSKKIVIPMEQILHFKIETVEEKGA